jgi:hypothetical protein
MYLVEEGLGWIESDSVDQEIKAKVYSKVVRHTMPIGIVVLLWRSV